MQNSLLSKEQILDGRYKIVQHIADGGYGAVYIVENIFMHKRWAMKIINQQVVSPIQIRRFQTEAKLMARLSHPNIVQAVDFGISVDDQPYFVMELLSGVTVSEQIKTNGALPVANAVGIVKTVCTALSYAHSLNVVHRDIKPSNIMLTGNSNSDVKLLDFGIASFSDGERSKLTVTGEIFGSPAYMSPEQCNAGKTDLRSDIYSLGCSFYEMLTGAAPFHGRTMLETMMMHISSPAPTLEEGSLGTKFPQALERIVKKMLSKSASDRYQHCNEIIQDLSQLENEAECVVEENLSKPPLSTGSSKKILPLAALMSLPIIITVICVCFWHFTHSSDEHKSQTTARLNEQSQTRKTIANVPESVFVPTTLPSSQSNNKFPNVVVRDHEVILDFGPSSMGDLYVDFDNGGPIIEHDARGRCSIPLGAKLSLETSIAYLNNHPEALRCFAPDRLTELSVLAPYDGVVWMEDNSNDAPFTTKTLSEGAKCSIASLTGLKKLRLKSLVLGNQLNDLGLSKLTSLTDLDLRNTDISGNQLVGAMDVKKLNTIRLENAAPCNLLVESLKGSQNIHELQLSRCKLDDSKLSAIGEVANVSSLVIKHNPLITNSGLSYLAHLQNLKQIDLRDTGVTPLCSKILMQLPKLHCLELSESTQYTKEFWKSEFPSKYVLQFKTETF